MQLPEVSYFHFSRTSLENLYGQVKLDSCQFPAIESNCCFCSVLFCSTVIDRASHYDFINSKKCSYHQLMPSCLSQVACICVRDEAGYFWTWYSLDSTQDTNQLKDLFAAAAVKGKSSISDKLLWEYKSPVSDIKKVGQTWTTWIMHFKGNLKNIFWKSFFKLVASPQTPHSCRTCFRQTSGGKIPPMTCLL